MPERTLGEANGANVLTIAVGHCLDTLNYVLAEFADLSAVPDFADAVARRKVLAAIENSAAPGKRVKT